MADKEKLTPLYHEHIRLNAKIGPFGGWLMPIQYRGIIAEHNWTRNSCSLFDICHMGEFLVYGDSSRSGLNRILTANLENMVCGSCHYGFMLNERGGVIDDLVIYRIREDAWMLVVNAATAGKDEAHLKNHLSRDSRLENISSKIGKLDLQGPLSRDILVSLIGATATSLKYYRFDTFSILGEENIISRTGYTGELGYEIYLSRGRIPELWKRILEDKRVEPAGLGARDTLRLEMGYPLYGQDLNDDVTPLEAGLENFVDFNKDFIGREALLKKQKEGIARRLVYFISDSRRSPRHNYKIYVDKKEAGLVTSGTFSPSLGCGIGMGYVEEGYGKASKKIVIAGDNIEIEALITKRPFYRKATAKIN